MATSIAGTFATAKRGGVTLSDIDRAQAALGSRATTSQIAKYLGRCVADVQAILNPKEKSHD